ncbi:peptidoglycan-recognition protein LF, partial [Asbolus verrucosus]
SNIQDFLGHEWKTSEVYNLTSRKVWQAHVPSSTMPKLKLPVTRVLFLQTNSSSCDSKSQCAKLVHELQLKHMSQWKEPDIVYNFLVSGDGSIFEGRGWNFQTTFSDYSSSKTVMIAFLGEFETNPPTLRQAESAKLFIDVAVMKGNLESCYNILILGENRFFIDMAQSIKQERFNCQN